MRSQRHLRARAGKDSAYDVQYPGMDYNFDWPGTWPSGSGGGGAPAEPALYTTSLTIGNDGSNYGFRSGQYGSISPTNLGGTDVLTVRIQVSGDLQIQMVGSAQIPGIGTDPVIITFPDWPQGPREFQLPWLSGTYELLVAGTDRNEWVANDGQTVTMEIRPVPAGMSLPPMPALGMASSVPVPPPAWRPGIDNTGAPDVVIVHMEHLSDGKNYVVGEAAAIMLVLDGGIHQVAAIVQAGQNAAGMAQALADAWTYTNSYTAVVEGSSVKFTYTNNDRVHSFDAIDVMSMLHPTAVAPPPVAPIPAPTPIPVLEPAMQLQVDAMNKEQLVTWIMENLYATATATHQIRQYLLRYDEAKLRSIIADAQTG